MLCFNENLNVNKLIMIDVGAWDLLYIELIDEKIKIIARPPKQRQKKKKNNIALYEEIKALVENKEALVVGYFYKTSLAWDFSAGDHERTHWSI